MKEHFPNFGRVAGTGRRPAVNATHVADSRKDKRANCAMAKGAFSTSLYGKNGFVKISKYLVIYRLKIKFC